MENPLPYKKMAMTDENTRKFLVALGKTLKGDSFTLNPMSGFEGSFYTTNRKEELIKEKEFESSGFYETGERA